MIAPLAGLALLFTSPSVLAAQEADELEDAEIDAIALPEAQFRQMLLMATMRTIPVSRSLATSGITAHCARFAPIFDKTIAANLPQWSANLREAYHAHVPQAELQRAVEAGTVAGAVIIAPYLEQIGGQMQEESMPLLHSSAAAMLEELFEATPDTPVEEIDMEARTAEIEAGIADGSVFCGLIPSRDSILTASPAGREG
jgi:hypothetical protein